LVQRWYTGEALVEELSNNSNPPKFLSIHIKRTMAFAWKAAGLT
jgi:hypothetical protein